MIVIHRCLNCTHPQYSHRVGVCNHGFCKCKHVEPGPSEVVRTFSASDPKHEEVLTVTPPGTYWNGESDAAGGRELMCGCGECQALAADLGVAL